MGSTAGGRATAGRWIGLFKPSFARSTCTSFSTRKYGFREGLLCRCGIAMMNDDSSHLDENFKVNELSLKDEFTPWCYVELSVGGGEDNCLP